MFTGLIETTGTLQSLRDSGNGLSRLTVAVSDGWAAELGIGDSVAVQGACLTVVDASENVFSVDVLKETLSRTCLGQKGRGALLNLERAMTLDRRLDGHLVTGHVDGQGRVLQVGHDTEGDRVVKIACEQALLVGMVLKGSVALDGISLTISNLERGSFQVSIIPHTWQHTSLHSLRVGHMVNIETDVIGKYVQRYVSLGQGESKLRLQQMIDAGFS